MMNSDTIAHRESEGNHFSSIYGSGQAIKEDVSIFIQILATCIFT